MEAIRKVIEWFATDTSHNIVYTYHNAKHDRDVYMVALRDEEDVYKRLSLSIWLCRKSGSIRLITVPSIAHC